MKWNQRTIWNLVKDDGTLAVGWYQIGTYWYYLDAYGVMVTGWFKDTNGKWYFLDENGRMLNNKWYQDTNEKWYYLGSDGAMYLAGAFTIDGKNYSFDDTGAWQNSILSDRGADFIGSWEGFWSKADYDPCYPGVKKYITIGYGTTYEARPDAFPNGIDSTCTIEQARKWLIEEGQDKAETIKADLDSRGITLKQNELDALISFAYNCGAGQIGLLGSTLYKNVCAGIRDSNTIISNFVAWNKANGVAESGLTRRRNSEADLFLNGNYIGNN